MRSITRTGRGTTATEPGPCRSAADRRIALGLLGTAATAGVASYLHQYWRIALSFTTPAPTTTGLRITEVTYPSRTEHIRAVRADLRAVLGDCAWGSDGDHTTRTIWARFDWPEQPQPDLRPGQGVNGHTGTRHHR